MDRQNAFREQEMNMGIKVKKDSDRYSTYYVTMHVHSMWECK